MAFSGLIPAAIPSEFVGPDFEPVASIHFLVGRSRSKNGCFLGFAGLGGGAVVAGCVADPGTAGPGAADPGADASHVDQ
jgi:hypothetical protein